jgi:hypothetical protein
MSLDETLIEVTLSEYEMRIYCWMRQGVTAYAAAKELKRRKQTVMREFKAVKEKIIEAHTRATEGGLRFTVTIAHGHEAYSVVDTTQLEVFRKIR